MSLLLLGGNLPFFVRLVGDLGRQRRARREIERILAERALDLRAPLEVDGFTFDRWKLAQAWAHGPMGGSSEERLLAIAHLAGLPSDPARTSVIGLIDGPNLAVRLRPLRD